MKNTFESVQKSPNSDQIINNENESENLEQKEISFSSKEEFLKYVRKIFFASSLFLATYGAAYSQENASDKKQDKIETTFEKIPQIQCEDFERKVLEVDSLGDVLVKVLQEHHIGTLKKLKDGGEQFHYQSKDLDFTAKKSSCDIKSNKTLFGEKTFAKDDVLLNLRGMPTAVPNYEHHDYWVTMTSKDKLASYTSGGLRSSKNSEIETKGYSYEDLKNSAEKLSENLKEIISSLEK